MKYSSLCSSSCFIFFIAIFSFASLVTKCDAGNIVIDFFCCVIAPVSVSNSDILSIVSPKKSILIAFPCSLIGTISSISPLTLKDPLFKSILFLSYSIFTSFSNTSSLFIS